MDTKLQTESGRLTTFAKKIIFAAAFVAAVGTLYTAYRFFGGDTLVSESSNKIHIEKTENAIEKRDSVYAKRLKKIVSDDWERKRLRVIDKKEQLKDSDMPEHRKKELREQIRLYENSIENDIEEYNTYDEIIKEQIDLGTK